MLRFHEHTPPTVLVEHHPDDHLVVATVAWPYAQAGPNDTYRMEPSPGLTLELDSRFPMRPTGASIKDAEPAVEALATLLGEPLAQAMLDAPRVGLCTLPLELGHENRTALAHIQATHPETPLYVQLACHAFIGAAVNS